jgi:hypothetical protein
MTPEQREKLPVYAKDALKALEYKIHDLQQALEAYSHKTASRVTWGWDFKDQAWGYLADGETITFKMLEKPERCIRVRLREDNRLSVNGDGTIIVIPGASNDLEIRCLERP